MNFESSIREKRGTLKPTITTIHSNNGEIYQETRDDSGNLKLIKLNSNAPGYVVDETPDLSVSKILPWLYLGSQDVVHDYDLIMTHNITHILSIGIPCPQYPDISNTYVNALDLEEFRIADIFSKCIEIIDTEHQNSGICYVHCNAGVSRSPTVVAAYLIKHNKITNTDAIMKIKQIRPKINPNRGFLQQLQEFEREILTNR